MNRLLLLALALLCGYSNGQLLAPTIPEVKSCPLGSVIMVLHEGKSGASISNSGVQVTASGLTECSDLCKKDDTCAGFDYSTGSCLKYQSVDPSAVSLKVGTNFYQKSCVTTTRVCSSPFIFDMRPQKILVGFAREVVPADTVQQCFDACLNSFDIFGFECESVMYYSADSECILNTEDRLDRPDLFVDEIEDEVIYFDNNCAGSQCYAPYVTQYIKVTGKQLTDEMDVEITTDFESCEYMCSQRISETGMDLSCKSFMYNAETQLCVLSDERSKPLGRATFVDKTGMDYYEKKCFASPRTCRNTPSFDRVPQMILVGFAAFVMENVPSVTMCLDQCTNPPPETGSDFECKSVMYYYNEQECILNAETRSSKPDLFIPEGDDFQVDYFDITCELKEESCPTGRRPSSVRTADVSLSPGENGLHVIETVSPTSVAECREKCYARSPDKCRSFNYDNNADSCELLYIETETLRPVSTPGVDHYDMHCLADEIAGVIMTVRHVQCPQGDETHAFDRYLNSKQSGKPILGEMYGPIALDVCLQRCIENENCVGVNFHRRHGSCDLFDSLDGPGDPDEEVDFYENVCGGKGAIRPEFKKPVTPKIEGVGIGQQGPYSVDSGPPGAQTICNFDGMAFQVTVDQEFTGAVFVKNKYDSCRVEVKNARTALLPLGFPSKLSLRQAKAAATGKFRRAKRQYGNVGPPLRTDDGYGNAPVAQPAGGYGQVAPPQTDSYEPQPPAAQPDVYQPTTAGGYDIPQPPAAQTDSYEPESPPQPYAPTTVGGYDSPQPPATDSYAPESPQPYEPTTVGGYDSPQPPAAQPDPYEPAPPATDGYEQPATQQTDSYGTEPQAPTGGYDGGDAGDYDESEGDVSGRNCGLEERGDGNYHATVVVQANNLGIPGLVTSMDRIYEISCDYSSMLGGKITANANLNVNGPEPTDINPKGKIQLSTPIMMQMMGKDGSEAVLQAKLGDILELRWEMMALEDQMDFFVRDCFAEPGGPSTPQSSGNNGGYRAKRQYGQPPEDGYGGADSSFSSSSNGKPAGVEKLQLIEKGCPTPAVAAKLIREPIKSVSNKLKTAQLQAFRFDSSRSVRVICHLEVCEGNCNPTSCSIDGSQSESYGRKKRDEQSVNDIEYDPYLSNESFETNSYIVPRRTNAMTSLVVIDPMQEVTTVSRHQDSFRSKEQRPVVPAVFQKGLQAVMQGL